MARQVFSELGYERTTFQEIATRAGLTRPAVNHYFRDKTALYRALFDSVKESVVGASVGQAVAQETLPGQLSAFLDAAVQIDSGDRSFARFMAASVLDGYRHEGLRGSTLEQIEQVREFVRLALRSAVESGEVREDLDIPAVTEMLIAILWGMALYAGFVGTHDQLEVVVDQFSRLIAGALW
ncbi:TetR/AcrR family transcriptional regulator [Actinophytocola sp.]|uniref:TetR/AcrR family transcriptional regulator n=1 Tax=Actinophytocola sp. TaxID=1872138 RepID=UPI002D36D144|nr:TetR/AcrR family transcriptional regulator [Actinophytocola sp.]HYQ65635.1 TetR/AcrR family transcriptional regulator [Actinophytocola sp.]